MTTKTDNYVAMTIAQQIGNGALFMIGAKNYVYTENSLAFKIGRNSKSVNYIKITLNVMDLYDMEFIMMRAGKKTIKSTADNVYFDQLREMIESNTGLYTSL